MKNIGKRSLSAVLALLMICSCFVIGVYATECPVNVAETVTYAYPETGGATATFAKPDGYTIEFKSISPTDATGPMKLEDGTTMYMIKAGTQYTVTADITVGSDKYENEKIIIKAKLKRDKPASITATATKDSIIVNKINGNDISKVKDVELRLLDENDTVVSGYDWKEGQSEFKKLKSGTKYTINARFKETDTYAPTEAAFLTKTTLKAYSGSVPAVAFTSVSKNSITFKKVNNAVYSLDGGKTWQTSNVFSNLKADTVYQATQKIVDPNGAVEDSKTAPVVAIRTNAADTFNATVADAKVDGIKSGGTVSTTSAYTFKIYEVKRTTGKAQWGDTKLIPYAVKTTNVKSKNSTGGKIYKEKDKNGKENSYWTGEIQPAETGSTNVVITYVKYEYQGKDASGKKDVWKLVKNDKGEIVTFDKTINVNASSTPLSLLNFLNVFTNTLPRLLTQFIEILRKYGISILLAI